MDALQAIHTRRSIRAYQDRPVSEELVQQILTAAMYAPSAGNAQPWQFVVTNDRKLLQQIPKLHPTLRWPSKPRWRSSSAATLVVRNTLATGPSTAPRPWRTCS